MKSHEITVFIRFHKISSDFKNWIIFQNLWKQKLENFWVQMFIKFSQWCFKEKEVLGCNGVYIFNFGYACESIFCDVKL